MLIYINTSDFQFEDLDCSVTHEFEVYLLKGGGGMPEKYIHIYTVTSE